MKRFLPGAVVMMTPTVASAHPGGHGHLTFVEFLGHLFAWDHLGIAVTAGLIGWLIVRRRRVGQRS